MSRIRRSRLVELAIAAAVLLLGCASPPITSGPQSVVSVTIECQVFYRASTNESLSDGTKVTIFFRKTALREAGLLPKSGVARFYGTAEVHKSGAVYDEVWRRLVEPEKDRDPDKLGYAVLINVERAEDFSGDALPADA